MEKTSGLARLPDCASRRHCISAPFGWRPIYNARHMVRFRQGPGRPRKYGRAARAVTVTLPEDVLARLAVVNADLGQAIVALTERNGKGPVPRRQPAEIAAYGNHAVIVVNPAKALKRLPGVQLVPLGNGRALISLDPEYSIPQLELDIRDALEHSGVAGAERKLLGIIGSILRDARQSPQIAATQRTIIVLKRKRQRRSGRRRSER